MELETDFTTYLEAKLDERGWSLSDFASRADLSPSVIFRWRKGYKPTIDNARVIAHTLESPVLEVLVASGVLTADEAGYGHSPIQTASMVDLTAELHRRAEAEHQRQWQERDYRDTLEQIQTVLRENPIQLVSKREHGHRARPASTHTPQPEEAIPSDD